MGKYKLLIRESAAKELESIPKKALQKLIGRIQALEDNPRPAGCQKLSVQERYRLRQGNYRIIYSVQDEEQTVTIVKIGHRREVYR